MTKIIPSIIGLGYVGLPIFLRLQKKFECIGYDIDKDRIRQLTSKSDDNNEFNKRDLIKFNNSQFTNSSKLLKKSNFYIVTVPTPIFKNNKPNLKHLINASKLIGKNIKKNDIVFFESTVYPGTTKKLSKIIEKVCKLKSNKDFWIGYSPERVNPGDKNKTIDKIKKIVSFNNCPVDIKNNILKVYKTISRHLVYSNSIEEAETSKVIENIQRDINIAFMNEIMMVCEKLNINFFKVIKLAKTKWNFLDYKAGLVGGHCLPVDPYYLYDLAKQNKFDAKFILAGRNVNNSMVEFVKKKILKEIKDRHLKNILIAGLSFKKNVSDLRNSLALKIFKDLKRMRNLNIDAVDPIIHKNREKKILQLSKVKLTNYDLIVYLVDHDILRKFFLKYFKTNKEKFLDIFNFLSK